jgi:hypothetical protein
MQLAGMHPAQGVRAPGKHYMTSPCYAHHKQVSFMIEWVTPRHSPSWAVQRPAAWPSQAHSQAAALVGTAQLNGVCAKLVGCSMLGLAGGRMGHVAPGLPC